MRIVIPRGLGDLHLFQRQAADPQELATASLRARNYRAALSFSEEVLRSVPDQPDALKIRNEARAMIAKFEETAGAIPLREVGRLVAQEAEKEAIDRVLQHTQWNRKRAARLLGVSYKTLLHKIRDCGLAPE